MGLSSTLRVPRVRTSVNWFNVVRGVQAFFSLVVLGLMSYVVDWWTDNHKLFPPYEFNFLLFAPIWTLLSLLVLVLLPWKLPAFAERKAARIGLLALEILTALHWFAGFVALTVFLTERTCFGTVCDAAKSSVAVSAGSWVAWTGTVVVGVVRLVRGPKGTGMESERRVEMHQSV